MKFKHIYHLSFILLISCNQHTVDVMADFKSDKIAWHVDPSEAKPINEAWVQKDSLVLSELKEVLSKDESNVINFLKIDENTKKTALGFRYERIDRNIGAGYVSIFYTLILKEGQVISYEFRPQLPRNKNLTERYLKLYAGIFKSDDTRVYNRYYNIQAMETPMRDIYSDISLNEDIKFLMTPFSGTSYDYTGAYVRGATSNRAFYLKEKQNISPEVCWMLMNSKNPSTRLMAIEHYIKNTSDFNNPDVIDKWIETVYSEVPTIEISAGCIETYRNSKKLVAEYIQRDN